LLYLILGHWIPAIPAGMTTVLVGFVFVRHLGRVADIQDLGVLILV